MRIAHQELSRRAGFLASVCAALLLCLPACEKPPAAPKPEPKNLPNILLISVDTLRPDHLGCYGYARQTSPNIDRLATEGAVFENVISSTSWTLPAHAALFTGLYDSVHGCLDTNKPLSDNRITLAERLKDAGYTTAGFFSGPYLHPVFGLGQGFDEYVDCTSYSGLNTEEAKEKGKVDSDQVFDQAVEDITNPRVLERVSTWLRKSPSQPFLLFIHMWDVHYDFIPPAPYDKKFDPDYDGWVDGRNVLHDTRIVETMPKRDLDHLIALYDGEIAWTDEHIGQILKVLEELGLHDSTIVILTADHGTEFFEHGLKTHRQTLYDEVIRIPLIIRFPNHVAAGTRFAEQARIIDVLPTAMDLAGLGEPDDVMGQSLAPLFASAKLKQDSLAISELQCDVRRLLPDGKWLPRNPQREIQQELRAFRRPQWKLLLDLNERRTQAFDLKHDPGEQHPLENIPTAIIDESRRADSRLKDYRAAMPPPGAAGSIPIEVLRQLRAVGYLGDDTEDETPFESPSSQPASAPTTAPTSAPSTHPGESPAP